MLRKPCFPDLRFCATGPEEKGARPRLGPSLGTLHLDVTARRILDHRQLAVAGDEQSKLLQDMALVNLDGQKQQIERYLIEARFALARLYDRRKKGELNDE